MKIFLDLETIPDQAPGALEAIRATIKPPANYSKPDTIAKWMSDNGPLEADKQWRKTALSGTSGQIICIGFSFGENAGVETLFRVCFKFQGNAKIKPVRPALFEQLNLPKTVA
jgi:hypothetical protein